MGEVLHLPGGDAAGLSRTHHHHDAPLDVQRGLLLREGPEALEGVLRHPGEIPMCLTRSEERRVGKECRSRWSPYH